MAAQRFDFQIYPAGQHGGITAYPYSGVINGFAVSNPAVTSASTFTVNVAPGAAKLDGVRVENAAAITGLQLNAPAGVNLTTANIELPVYLNPVRLVPALLTAPATAAEGDRYIHVADLIDYLLENQVYKYKSGVWTPYDSVQAPPAYGHNNLPLNEVVPVVDTATTNNRSFACQDEKVVYHKSPLPPYVARTSLAYLRQAAGTPLATVRFSGGSASVIEGVPESARIAV